MIDEPGFVLRDGQFAQATTRAGSQPADVVRNLHQRGSQRFQGALRKDDFIVRRKRGELVGMRAEGKPREFGDLLGRALREFGMRVQPRAHRSSADGEVVESVEHLLQALDVALQQTGPSAELLSEGQRNGILQVGAADFYYVLEFFRLGCDGVMNGLDWRESARSSPAPRPRCASPPETCRWTTATC